jgi:phosphomannomutase
MYLDIASHVYRNAGLNVLLLPGVSSTSHFYFTAMQHSECAGVMCGASHNPAGDTGRKTVAPRVKPIAEHIGPAGGLDKIKELYIEDAPLANARRGWIKPVNNLAEYVEYSMALAGVEPGSLNGVSLLHDYLFGAGGREMMVAFDLACASLDPWHFAPDGRFPLGDPNPVKAPVVKEGLDALVGGNYLLGTFFDGDADRVDFYAGDGRYLSSSFVYAGILPLIAERFAGKSITVFADLKSNPLALIEMAKAGVGVGVMRNGHSQIKNALSDDPATIGAVEESAHFYESFFLNGAGPFSTENTLYIALLVARAWNENPKRFEELFAIQGATSREREWGHYFPTDTDRQKALDAVQAHFESQGAVARNTTQGGMDLEATMMRRGLPFEIATDTRLESGWVQICQRISQSENGLARWEVVAGDAQIAADAKATIQSLVKQFGGSEPYQG